MEDAGTCSHGWLFTLLPRTDYLNELLPYVPSLLFLIPLFLVSRSALLNATVSGPHLVFNHCQSPYCTLRKLYLTGGRSSRSIGGGMPGAGGPGGRNVFSIGKALGGEVTDDNCTVQALSLLVTGAIVSQDLSA